MIVRVLLLCLLCCSVHPSMVPALREVDKLRLYNAERAAGRTELPVYPDVTRGYRLQPYIEELLAMSPAQLASVRDFTVSCAGFGSIRWLVPVDIRGLNIPAIVQILDGEVGSRRSLRLLTTCSCVSLVLCVCVCCLLRGRWWCTAGRWSLTSPAWVRA